MEKTLYPSSAGIAGRIVLAFFLIWSGLNLHSLSGFYRLLTIAGGFFIVAPAFGSLKLDANGFSYRTLFWGKSARWIDIGTFVIVTQRALIFIPVHRGVGWRYGDSFKRSLTGKLAKAFTKFDEIFPDTYGLKAIELAALLEDYRQRALAAQPVNQFAATGPHAS